MAVRPLDTSTLGPIRVRIPGDLTPRQRARELFAAKVAAHGPAWQNAASSIRSGWSNLWIDAGIEAIVEVLRLVPEGDEE